MKPNNRRSRAISVIGLVALATGAALLSWPLLCQASSWSWTPRNASDLADATVNAELVSVDEAGLRLTQQGERHISVITPALRLAPDCEPEVAITVSLPGVPPATPIETTVVLLWQTEQAEGFHFAEKAVALSDQPSCVHLGLTVPPSAVHRLGVQFRGLHGTVQLDSIALPETTLGGRLRSVWAGLTASEPLQNHSINFLRGPILLGHGMNYYLVSLVLVGSGGYLCGCAIRRRRVSTKAIAAVAMLVWCAGDFLSTRDLIHQYRMEATAYDPTSGADPIAVANGPEIAWAHACMLEHTPTGSTFAVVSDDPFAPSHRLGYLLEPQRIRRAAYENADFILVFHASQAAFDLQEGLFRLKDGPAVMTEPVSALMPSHPDLPPNVYLLRRVEP